MEIILWDLDLNRVAEISRNLRLALKEADMKANLIIMSEPPLISRMNLTHRVPILEIEGEYWSLRPGETITKKQCSQLLNILSRRS